VHLHGGLTPASYDGWAENLFAPGQHAVFRYPGDQRAALLWYHDHVMGVTKFDVCAGLAGLWIIRDERERELGLPEGPPFELPLLIQDRNFDLDRQGRPTGRLVHKTDPEVMEAFAPFTTVNGKIWPVLDVTPATYRFRVINGSNARTYRLVLLRDGTPDLDRVTQIGTDHGLLRTQVRVPPDGLVLASAERADLLVELSDLEPGSELTLLNTAAAPFDGSPFPASDALNAADLDGLLPYPQVMRFRVIQGPVTRRAIPRELATDYRPPTPEALAGAPRRVIALVERELDGEPNMLTMRELAIAPAEHTGPLLTLAEGEQTTRYRTVASKFDHTIDDNERGLKDTVRVNPNEIVEIAVRFTTYAGRYMYHCHILEHEDRDMMRPFVTMPTELMPFMS
jgi:spore coat protein A